MSIAAIASSFVTAVRAAAPLAPVTPVQPGRSVQRGEHEGGCRHELVDAMNQVLGVEGEPSKDEAQAVFRFAHALMHDLRSIDAGSATALGNGHGRGHAWGRRDWSDLPQRIDALATAAGAPASPVSPTPTAPATPDAVAPAAQVAAPPLSEPLPLPVIDNSAAAEVPPPASPVTTTSAAVHLMQVPSSRLIEAYAALRQALGEQSTTPASGDLRSQLAAFLDRLSNQLAPDAPAALPAGSVLHLTA